MKNFLINLLKFIGDVISIIVGLIVIVFFYAYILAIVLVIVLTPFLILIIGILTVLGLARI